jgi:DNA-directed RNA polymerase beta subunit
MIARTAVFDVATIRDMLYVTLQHAASVRSRAEALELLAQYQHTGNSQRHQGATQGASATSPVEDLLHANVLPHLAHPQTKIAYLAHMVGILLNHMFDPTWRTSQQHDKDFLGNKRVVLGMPQCFWDLPTR